MISKEKNSQLNRILIVGGGSAGWVTASLIAAICRSSNREINITLVESPNIPLLGVGEGTWPSMRKTLQTIGLSERQFLTHCDASFKQGSAFVDWLKPGHRYFHPFSLPHAYSSLPLADYANKKVPFAEQVSAQPEVCNQHLAPKQRQMPDFAFALNYGYHLDAVKFANLLTQHGVSKLGIKHHLAEVASVETRGDEISSVTLSDGETLSADLYIDCTGTRSLLLGEALKTPLVSVEASLPNNRAIAVQVPYGDESDDIASVTKSTAQSVGWIWDIGLQSRRGVGQVYSSQFISDEEAELQLRSYVEETAPHVNFDQLNKKYLKFQPGYREVFWKGNCVAVGMAAGFIEPLEASALALIEQSARFVAEKLPRSKTNLNIVAKRFNEKFLYHWQGIVDFLSLHYVLSDRNDSEYWRTMGSQDRLSLRLKDSLALWAECSPSLDERPMIDELFPMASYIYVLEGMNYRHQNMGNVILAPDAKQAFLDVAKMTQQCLKNLPNNRTLLNEIRAAEDRAAQTA